MATVIYSNMGDTDTEILKNIWKEYPKVKVIEINKHTVNPIEKVNAAISNEKDTLIMCGHGSPNGLFNPNFNNGSFLISNKNKHLIKAKRIIGVWCHAKEFAIQNDMKGFWSSMFISNRMEAMLNGINSISNKCIWNEEKLFCDRLNKLIKNYIPMKKWIYDLKSKADYKNPVVKFNYDGLKYFKNSSKI